MNPPGFLIPPLKPLKPTVKYGQEPAFLKPCNKNQKEENQKKKIKEEEEESLILSDTNCIDQTCCSVRKEQPHRQLRDQH